MQQPKTRITRLEDYIGMAREGKNIELAIELKKKIVIQKAAPSEQCGPGEPEMYLLMADYYPAGSSPCADNVVKVYVHGWTNEDAAEASSNRHIANERLKMDYERLRTGGVKFQPRFF